MICRPALRRTRRRSEKPQDSHFDLSLNWPPIHRTRIERQAQRSIRRSAEDAISRSRAGRLQRSRYRDSVLKNSDNGPRFFHNHSPGPRDQRYPSITSLYKTLMLSIFFRPKFANESRLPLLRAKSLTEAVTFVTLTGAERRNHFQT